MIFGIKFDKVVPYCGSDIVMPKCVPCGYINQDYNSSTSLFAIQCMLPMSDRHG